MKLTVQPGDTLGRLTQLALNQATPNAAAGRTPFPALMQKVQAVAAQNQIPNADRIFPGQVIDFSSVSSIPDSETLLLREAAPTAAIDQPLQPASSHRLMEQTLNRAVARGYIPAQDVSAVRGQILDMARTYGFSPDDFARVALIESDGLNPKASNGNCHGVIQFCDGDDRGAASVGYGKNPRAILSMSVREQLTLVDQYFQDTGLKNYKAPSLDTLYLTVLFPAARDERQPHRPLPIPGPQASALHVGGNQDGPITRASVRKGLIAHANQRLAQFAKDQVRESAQVAQRVVPTPAPPPITTVEVDRASHTEVATARPVPPRAPWITGSIPRLPDLLPNFSVPSVSTQSVLNARRQS